MDTPSGTHSGSFGADDFLSVAVAAEQFGELVSHVIGRDCSEVDRDEYAKSCAQEFFSAAQDMKRLALVEDAHLAASRRITGRRIA